MDGWMPLAGNATGCGCHWYALFCPGRHVNRLCLAVNKPLIESGTTGYLGQVRNNKNRNGTTNALKFRRTSTRNSSMNSIRRKTRNSSRNILSGEIAGTLTGADLEPSYYRNSTKNSTGNGTRNSSVNKPGTVSRATFWRVILCVPPVAFLVCVL